jgi:uncharacterized membrane protein YeaQ/YmgE (transglycosylase-associated protein family)
VPVDSISGENIMAMFALIDLEPGGIIAWLIVGLVAGFLAGKVMRGAGYGLVGDLVVGLVGAFLGGYFSGMFITGSYGLVGSIIVAFVGACVLIWVVQLITSRRSYL